MTHNQGILLVKTETLERRQQKAPGADIETLECQFWSRWESVGKKRENLLNQHQNWHCWMYQ